LKGEPATEATDVFALGLMGYELLTGQGPFTGSTQRETIMRSLREPPTPLENLRPGVDPALAKLLERCLAKEPGKRPSAAFVAKALRSGGEANSGRERAGAGATAAEGTVVEALLKRRLPQTVVGTFAIGIAFLYFIGLLADVGDNPFFQAGLATFVASLIASGIIAWFHGEKGPQRVTPLEVLLLSLVALVWAALVAASFLLR
jgi:serine/threonine-protein kinase